MSAAESITPAKHRSSTSRTDSISTSSKTKKDSVNGKNTSFSSNNEPSEDNVDVLFNKDKKENLTLYEKLLYESHHDPRFKAEEKAGRRIGFYRIVKDIGFGNFSRVKLGVHVLAKEKVAIKILDKTKLDPSTQRLLLREITSMEHFHHPNIIRLYEVIETSTDIYIVTEYASGGDVYSHITENGKFAEDEAKHIFAQIVAAVEHMHSKGVIHRDIKSENILFAKERLIKLADFGFSTYSEKNQKLTTFCGSPPYAAPELYRDENYVGIYVDIWAMGVTLYFMVTGLMPFRAENVGKLRKSITDGNYSIPAHVSSECQKLIYGLLSSEINERWSIEEIRSCSWLSGEYFPEEYKPLPINLSQTWISATKIKTATVIHALSSFEYETYSRLEELGITPEQVRRANPASTEKYLSNRSDINGTYRILLHRIQQQSNDLERDATYDKRMQEEASPSRRHSMAVNGEVGARKNSIRSNQTYQSQSMKTKTCIIV